MTRTGNEVFDQERADHQDRQNEAANPPRDGRRGQTQRRFRQELKEEHAGGEQHRAAKKETGTQNQGNAVLGALETNQSHGGENKGQQTADHLEIALKQAVGGPGQGAQPIRTKNHKQKSRDVRQEDCRACACVRKRSLAHSLFRSQLFAMLEPGCPGCHALLN